MPEDPNLIDRVRFAAAMLDLPLHDDDIDTVASCYRTHAEEGLRLRASAGLTDEPPCAFTPLRRNQSAGIER